MMVSKGGGSWGVGSGGGGLQGTARQRLSGYGRKRRPGAG